MSIYLCTIFFSASPVHLFMYPVLFYLFCVCVGMKELDFATSNSTNYLYTTEYNLVDFNVDENGLWVIYSMPESNNTIVSMLNPITLEALYSLNISINHHKVSWINLESCRRVMYEIYMTRKSQHKIKIDFFCALLFMHLLFFITRTDGIGWWGM